MILPEVGVGDLHNSLMEQSELLGVDPAQLLSALSKVFESVRIGQDGIDDLRIKRGQALISSTPVKNYPESQELARTIGLERAELIGVSSAERRIECGFRAAQILIDMEEAEQQPDLQLVQQIEVQVA